MTYNDYIDKMPDDVYTAINMAHARTRVHAYTYNNVDTNICSPKTNTDEIANNDVISDEESESLVDCNASPHGILRRPSVAQDDTGCGCASHLGMLPLASLGQDDTGYTQDNTRCAQDDTKKSGASPHGMFRSRYAPDFMKTKHQIEQAEATSKMSCRAESRHPDHRENATHNRATKGENMTLNNSILKQFNDTDDTKSIKKTLPGGKAVGLGYDGVRGARVCATMDNNRITKMNSVSYFRTLNECGKGHACMKI